MRKVQNKLKKGLWSGRKTRRVGVPGAKRGAILRRREESSGLCTNEIPGKMRREK